MNNLNASFIDGDFKTNMGNCKYHCSPTCYPGQIGPEWHYGCTHKAWPENKYGDFVPFVKCEGKKENCDLKDYKKLIKKTNKLKIKYIKYTAEE